MPQSLLPRATALVVLALAGHSLSAEPTPLALALDEMAAKGAGFEAQKLHELGTDGLAGALEYLFEFKGPTGPSEDDIRRLIAQLDDDDFATRERATEELIRRAGPRRELVEEAAKSDPAEIRVRAQRVLDGLPSQPTLRLGSYLSGFWTYAEGIRDSERLDFLARRTTKALATEMPGGDRLHLTRLCIAALARGRDEASCEILRPLVKHQDDRVAVLVIETFGGYSTDSSFVPQLVADALTSQRPAVVEAALRSTARCQDPARREQVQQSLRAIFIGNRESLKFLACLPLMHDFQDPEAWAYVLQQTQANDRARAKTALAWLGAAGQGKHSAPPEVLKLLLPMLKARSDELRLAAVQGIGGFTGEEVVRSLIPLLMDSQAAIAEQAAASLLAQPDEELVRRLLTDAAWKYPSQKVRTQARQLLARLKMP